jgi:uncharacterized protein
MTGPAASGVKKCPLCGNPADEKFKPFCGKRCADIDLNRWLSGVYTLPVKEADDEDGERAPSIVVDDEP